MKKITEKIYIIGKEGSLQGNDNDRKDVSKILHSDVSKILIYGKLLIITNT